MMKEIKQMKGTLNHPENQNMFFCQSFFPSCIVKCAVLIELVDCPWDLEVITLIKDKLNYTLSRI